MKKRWKTVLLVIIAVLILPIILRIVFVYVSERHVPKEDIVQSFNANFEKFRTIVEYAEKVEGNLYVEYGFLRKWEMRNGKNKIDDKEISGQIQYITRKLNFRGIYEDEDCITFVREEGHDEQGIFYLKNGNLPTYGIKLMPIKDKWYYYLIKRPD